jgi:xanthine dehydrogenase accessory factor
VRELLRDIERWHARGEKVAVATVVATRKSAPRPIGSKLAVSESGEIAGSVSGGCVENDVVLAAQEVISGGESRLLTYGITDDMAFGIGLPCGGEIDVFVEPLTDVVTSGVVLTEIAGPAVGTKLDDPELVKAAMRRGRSHVVTRDDRAIFADVYSPPPRLLVYGAIDTADALCAAAKLMGWHTIVADARPRFATEERLPNADEVIVAWPEETLAQVSPDSSTAIVVLTHDDKFDIPMMQAALETDVYYLGWLGSRRNQERRRGVLRENGVTDTELARISGPSGLDIGADTPTETALSILAEILAVRSGRDGGRLKDGTASIHVGAVRA